MTRTPGCTCLRGDRRWQPNGVCERCGNRVLEIQIQDVVREVMVSDPRCLLWRNEIGMTTHLPDGTKRKAPIKYGVCNPGGADLIGLYGPLFLAVETKTPKGAQTIVQKKFQSWIEQRGGVYAVCRGEADARTLLARLASAV